MSVDPFAAARATLAIMAAATPVEGDEDAMFPQYRDAAALCRAMVMSMSKWPDRAFASKAIAAFARGDARLGMQVAHENVYFYLPKECTWTYLDD